MVRGIRGAITVEQNTMEDICSATAEMLMEIIGQNAFDKGSIVSILFTTTPDLNAAFPAVAARQLGWLQVPMMCAQEIAVPDALAKCVRVLLTVNTDKNQNEIQHVYLRGAKVLRPDLT